MIELKYTHTESDRALRQKAVKALERAKAREKELIAQQTECKSMTFARCTVKVYAEGGFDRMFGKLKDAYEGEPQKKYRDLKSCKSNTLNK